MEPTATSVAASPKRGALMGNVRQPVSFNSSAQVTRSSRGYRDNFVRNFLYFGRFSHRINFSGNAIMDENRVAGTAKNLGGKVEEGFGRLTGDTKSQVDGIVNQAAGAAQDLYGQAADTARDTATTFDKWLRNQIETQPYTTALVAVGIGWLLGRLHRPV
ncbi:MAG TPA: CsbD family protein [Xanthobacteraceae bacterium]|nr:CsbD family protein [Xanthobacteraceae bacterium]